MNAVPGTDIAIDPGVLHNSEVARFDQLLSQFSPDVQEFLRPKVQEMFQHGYSNDLSLLYGILNAPGFQELPPSDQQSWLTPFYRSPLDQGPRPPLNERQMSECQGFISILESPAFLEMTPEMRTTVTHHLASNPLHCRIAFSLSL